MHGFAVTPDPQAVDTCVNAIITGDCAIVKAPETNIACSFLAPQLHVDASADAAATDQ